MSRIDEIGLRPVDQVESEERKEIGKLELPFSLENRALGPDCGGSVLIRFNFTFSNQIQKGFGPS